MLVQYYIILFMLQHINALVDHVTSFLKWIDHSYLKTV